VDADVFFISVVVSVLRKELRSTPIFNYT